MWIAINKFATVNTDSFAGIFMSPIKSDFRCDIYATKIVDDGKFYICPNLKFDSALYLYNNILDALARDVKLFDIDEAIRCYDGDGNFYDL